MKIYFILICSLFISNLCKADEKDSLQIISERLHAYFSSENARCFHIKIKIKPLIRRDTLTTQTRIKIFPTDPELDSLKNFYYICNDNEGYVRNSKSKIVFYPEQQKAFVIDNADFIERTTQVYPPMITNYNSFGLSVLPKQKFLISDDSIYYQGIKEYPEDSIVLIRTLSLRTKPYFSFVFSEEYIDTDRLFDQYYSYEVTELSSSALDIFPENLPENLHLLFPDFTWTETDRVDIRAEPSVRAGHQAPIWQGLLPNGDTLQSSDITERFLILDFWYTQCAPCWKAVTVLSNYNNNIQEDDIRIIGMNPFDWKSKEDALFAFKKQGGNYTVVFDPDKKTVKDYDVKGYPRIFVIDQQKNEIILRHEGYSDDMENKIKECIQRAMKP